VQPQPTSATPGTFVPPNAPASSGGKTGLGTILGAIALALAVAAIGINLVHGGPTGATGSTGAQGAPGLPATSLWAVVNATGSVQNGSGVTSAASEGVGAYQVIFDKDVRNCSYIATLGIPGSEGGGDQPAGYATTAARDSSVDGVWVNTFDGSGTLTDEPFNLAVYC